MTGSIQYDLEGLIDPNPQASAPIEGAREIDLNPSHSAVLLVIRPGDKLILRVPEICPKVEMVRLKQIVEKFLGREVLVVNGDIDFLTIREEREDSDDESE